MITNEKSILGVRQSSVVTPKGADLNLAAAFSPHNENGVEMAIIAHLKNKYDILSKSYGFSAEEKELLDSLTYVSGDEDFSRGEDPIIGRILGFIYEKPNISLRIPHTREVYEKLAEIKKDNPEYFLSLIRIKEDYKGIGIGSLMLKYAEYNAWNLRG